VEKYENPTHIRRCSPKVDKPFRRANSPNKPATDLSRRHRSYAKPICYPSPPELLREVDAFIEKNKHKGYTRREEFIRQTIRFFLKWESEEYEYIEIPKEKYEKLNEAVKIMRMPYYNAAEFIENQIDKALEQYEKFIEEKK